MQLQGKTAVVTGASRGIGRAIALALGQAGANVVLNYCRSREAAEDVVKLLTAGGVRAMAVQADVRDLEAVKQLMAQAIAEFGQLDILVNNAGLTRDNLVIFMKDEEWDEVLDTNLKGAFHCIKVAARDMVRRKAGRIINISSDAGLMGDMLRANYSAAKAGLLGLTKAVARELAPSGITVNAVAPGYTETDMTASLPENKRARQLERIPANRFGQPEEVAKLVLYLASPDAGYITGQVFSINGGLRM